MTDELGIGERKLLERLEQNQAMWVPASQEAMVQRLEARGLLIISTFHRMDYNGGKECRVLRAFGKRPGG